MNLMPDTSRYPRVLLGPIDAVVKAAVDHGWFSDSEDTRLMGYGKGLSGRYLATKDLIEASGSGQTLVGVYHDGMPAGIFWLEYHGERRKTVTMHCFISRGYRGKWTFTRAGTEILERLFAEGVYRVEVEPLRINKRVIALLRRCGFKQEGIKRSSLWMDGNDYDTVMMRLLKREWNRKKEN